MAQKDVGLKSLEDGPLAGTAGLAHWIEELGGEDSKKRVMSLCLTMAARRADVLLVRQLLEQGADPEMAEHARPGLDKDSLDSFNGEGRWKTPWSAALAADSPECLAAMVEAGMSSVKPRLLLENWLNEKRALLIIAIQKGAARCVEAALGWALEKNPVAVQEAMPDAWRELALGGAGGASVEAIAKSLMGAGGDIDSYCELAYPEPGMRQLILELAAENSSSVVEGLLAAGANPMLGFPASFAVGSDSESSLASLSLLLAGGVDPNRLSEEEGSLIQRAVEARSAEKIKALAGAGASLAALSESGLSMLALAALGGSSECVGALLAEGLDPDEVIDGLPLALWLESNDDQCREYYGNCDSKDKTVLEMIRAASEAKQLASASGVAAKRSPSPRI